MLCDKFDLNLHYQAESFANIQAGDLVWIRGANVESFFENIFPQIEQPFALVTGDSVKSFPKECALKSIGQIIQSPKLIHWFAQNCDPGDFPPNKFSAIPLGIDFHSQYEKASWRFKDLKTPGEQEALLSKLANSDPQQKINQAYADFQFNNTTRNLIKRDPKIKKDRKDIFKELKHNPAIYFQKKRLLRDDLWREMARFQFIISPHGTGLDCHRTWEALILGSYVIVEKSVLDELYVGLPVKILDSYTEISPVKLALWKEEFQNQYTYNDYIERLSNRHWIEQMRVIVAKKLAEGKHE